MLAVLRRVPVRHSRCISSLTNVNLYGRDQLPFRRIQTCIPSEILCRRLCQTAYRQSTPDKFPSFAPQTASRRKVEVAFEEMKSILSESDPDLELELVGAYRRGVEDVKLIKLLAIGQKDNRTPLFYSSPDRSVYEREILGIGEKLIVEGILDQTSATEYILRVNPEIHVEIHYVPRACHGAAKLYLTGDDSYIRFLKLFAMEGMGLTFDKFGLWKPVEDKSSAKRRSQRQSATQGALPSGVSIESIDAPMESEGDRRMRETRKAMGLPEGLDLSLDLSPGKEGKVDRKSDLEAYERDLQASSEGTEKHTLIKIEGKGGEADVLDVLGLVWIPPSMRTVKEPES